jgi:hypothetical protein
MFWCALLTIRQSRFAFTVLVLTLLSTPGSDVFLGDFDFILDLLGD